MKKKIGLFLGVLALSVTLIACSEASVEANVPLGYEVISSDKIGYDNKVYTLKHIDTNCFYSLSDKGDYRGGVSITQMFIEKNGVGVPYCEE